VNQKNKIIAGWIAFFFVIFHITALFIFASPPGFGLKAGKKIVSPYVVPLFEQTWSMFAPCPVVTGKLKIKIQYEDHETDWFYSIDNSRKWHSYLRGSHHGDLVILESNLVSWLKVDLNDFNLGLDGSVPRHLTSTFKEGHAYYLVRRYVYGWSKKLSDKKVTKAFVKVEMENVKTGEKGVFEMPEYQW
jgi:hypothetical protein